MGNFRFMMFYHGTTKKNWTKIQEDGFLWGKPPYNETWGTRKEYEEVLSREDAYRYTYLTPDLEIAESMGSKEVILEVEYDPVGNKIDGKTIDNYAFGPDPGQIVKPGDHCWQFSVFILISLDNVKVFKEK